MPGIGSKPTISATGDAHPIAAAESPREVEDVGDDALVGTQLERYRVEARLGAGGMGVVYAAYDPALDRRVALKLLPVTGAHRRDHLEQRLRREAQALAKLAHPNVVAVHDVGVAEHSVFVTMQLVEGASADRWLAAERRSTRAILDVLDDVGRGLAAAHAAGIVHRDVKPSNVLVDHRGRAYVSDFGLARGSEGEPGGEVITHDLLETSITRTGAVMGTPPYMAPEQHRGEPATPRSDQFSFCVMAWEALFGVHPFSARWNRNEAREAMARDAIGDVGRGRRVPARVTRALRRGLRHDPDARWPGMDALVAAIEPRSHAMWWGAGVLVTGVSAAVIVTSFVTAPALPACDASTTAWGPSEQSAVRAAFVATGRSYASDTYGRVARALADRTARWNVAHHDACRARGDETDALFDRRMACLHQRDDVTRALVEELSHDVDAAALDKGVGAIAKLDAIEDCADRDALLAHQAAPQTIVDRARIANLDHRLAAADALDDLGRYAQALAILQPIVGEARTLAYPDGAAKALYLEARVYDGLGNFKQAEATTYEAIAEAGRAGDDVLLARANLLAVFITNDEEGKPEVAGALLRTAAGLVGKLDRKDLTATMINYQGNLMYAQGKFAEAAQVLERAKQLELTAPADRLAAARALNTQSLAFGDGGDLPRSLASVTEALAIYRDALGVDHPDATTMVVNLAMAETRLGDDAHARAHFEQAIATYERVLGADNGELVAPLSDLSSVEADEGHLDRAIELERRAQAITEHTFGPDNPRMAWVLDTLAEQLRRAGKLDEADVTRRRALALATKLFGADHPDVAYDLDGLGQILADRGKLADARTQIEAGLALREKALGADNELVAVSLESLASVVQRQGDCAGATSRADRARTILEVKVGPESRELISALLTLARCASPGQAVPILERALAIATAKHADPVVTADVQVELARRLPDRQRSAALERAALAAWSQRPLARARELRELSTKLGAH